MEVISSLNQILKFDIKTKIGDRRAADSKYVVANVDKFKNYFSWEPKYNNLEYIIKTALDWEKKIKIK